MVSRTPIRCSFPDCTNVAVYRVIATLWGVRQTIGYVCDPHHSAPHAGVGHHTERMRGA
jgi:hypothetical protein